MKKRRYLIIIGLLLTVLTVNGQESNSRQFLEQAEEAYDVGRIDEAEYILKTNLNAFQGTLLQSAYRLLALCCLSEDREDEAWHYAEWLIKLNNYYNSAGDPARFQDIIRELKIGMTTTITTASSQSESINEAPSPVTIITSEMIEELGYNKNLNQILTTYVPGMAEILSEYVYNNLSMHGAYSIGQEMILIMENGHRLNSRFDNSAPGTYSISTEKIDHIEVLRGPASSLYGNVAVSAVVNIITKSGNTIDGVKLKYGYGSNNSHKADLLFGTQFMDADIAVWASLYNTDGRTRHFHDGEGYLSAWAPENWSEFYGPDRLYVGRYRNTPAHDIGMSIRLKGFEALFSHKNVKKAFEMGDQTGYDYDLYAPIEGVQLGANREDIHAELGYTRQQGRWFLKASLYGDWHVTRHYRPSYDEADFPTVALDENGDLILDENGNVVYSDSITIYRTQATYSSLMENVIGAQFRFNTDYRLGNMKGNLMAGCQYEYFSLNSGIQYELENMGLITSGYADYKSATAKGKEGYLSIFVQDKHYFLPQVILNVGLRYDLKYHQDNDNIQALSPRLALMYIPDDRFTLKLSYAESFADLAFYNRYIMEDPYLKMNPMRLSAVQLTAMGKAMDYKLDYEINLFYNKYSNLFCWYNRNKDFNEKNNGLLKNIGLEGTLAYTARRFSSHLTLYYCHDLSSEYYYYNDEEKTANNVPHFTLNLHGSWKAIQSARHELRFYGHASYTGKKLNYGQFPIDDFYVDDKLIFDLGLKYSYRQRLQLSFDCENLFDTDNYLCGPDGKYKPRLDRGRTLMASIALKF